MTNRPLLTALVATQLVFALACTGGASQDGSSVGSDVQLDGTAPPTSEHPDLQGDDRCDWLGQPFASEHRDAVFVLRMSDRQRDCDDSPRVERKLLYTVDGASARPLLDVSHLDDVRMIDARDGLLLLSERADETEHAWRIDPATGEVLDQADLTPFQVSASAPSGRWVAVANDGWMPDDGLALRLLDTADLSLAALPTAAGQGAFTWLPGDRIVTATFDDDGLLLALWDLSDSEVPDAPLATTLVPDLERPWYPEQHLAVAPDGARVAVPVFDGDDERAVIWDTTRGTSVLTEPVGGTLAFTDTDLLVGGRPVVTRWDVSGELRAIEPDGTARSIALDESPEFVSAPHGRNLLVAGNDEGLDLFDLRTHQLTSIALDGPVESHSLQGTTVWLAGTTGLRHVDLGSGAHGTVSGPATRHVLYLPTQDRLFTSEALAPTVHFVDPGTGASVATAALSGDLVGNPTPLHLP